MRVLRFQGKDQSVIDPYWDFEHTPGEPYDDAALRLIRARVFVPGDSPATVRLKLRVEQGQEGEEEIVDLDATKHVLRFTGEDARAADSYTPLDADTIVASPPLLVLALDVTRLPAGECVLVATALRDGAEASETRVIIERRAFYAFRPRE